MVSHSTSCCAADSCKITTLFNLKKPKTNKQNYNKNNRNDFNADTHHSVNCLLVWVTSVSLYSPKCPEPLTLAPPDLSSDMGMVLNHAIISHAGFCFSWRSSYLSERSFRKNQRVCCLAPNTSASLALHSLTPHGDTGDGNMGEKKKNKGRMWWWQNGQTREVSASVTLWKCTGREKGLVLHCHASAACSPDPEFADRDLATCVHQYRLCPHVQVYIFRTKGSATDASRAAYRSALVYKVSPSTMSKTVFTE